MIDNPRSTVQISGRPIHPILIPFPITLLVGGFVCDLGYLISGSLLWATVAMWSIGAGILTAAAAAVVGLIDFLGDHRIRAFGAAWQHFLANVTAVLLSILNFYLRVRDGADAAIWPWGVLLSVAVVALLLFSGWKGGELVFRHRVAVLNDPRRDVTP